MGLDSTVMCVPVDGCMTNLVLCEGARVASLPLSLVMTFIDTFDTIIGVEIQPIDHRHSRPGQPVELTFKFMPGRIWTGKVETVLQALSTGQTQASRQAVTPSAIEAALFIAHVRLNDMDLVKHVPAGSTGTAARFIDHVRAAMYLSGASAVARDRQRYQFVPSGIRGGE